MLVGLTLAQLAALGRQVIGDLTAGDMPGTPLENSHQQKGFAVKLVRALLW